MFQIQITPRIAADHLRNALAKLEEDKYEIAAESVSLAIPAFPANHHALLDRVANSVRSLKQTFDDRQYNRLREAIERAIEML